MNLKKLLVPAALLHLAGCAYAIQPLDTRTVVLKNYGPPDSVQTATVGEAIFRVQQAREIPVYIAQREQAVPGVRTPVTPRMPFTAYGRDKNGNFRLTNAEFDRYGFFTVTPDGHVVNFVPADAMENPRRLEQESEPLFRRAADYGDQPGAFTAEMVYSGLAGTVVRALYREYTDNLARPAFTQELQYDLGADSVIAYKSIRVRVLAATNSALRYSVLSDGDLPWLPAPRSPAPAIP